MAYDQQLADAEAEIQRLKDEAARFHNNWMDAEEQLREQEAEVERLLAKLNDARGGLEYALNHEAMGTCLCSAGKATAEAALRLSDPAESVDG